MSAKYPALEEAINPGTSGIADYLDQHVTEH
jgi:hypothetical protein